MTAPIRILIVEDRPEDAEIEAKRVRQAGFEVEWQRVDSKDDFVARLSPGVDLILADYGVPGFGGEQALELLKQRGLDIPFIIVSGTLGDEKAVELIKAGATDYILKNNLARLGEAVRRALAERQLRKDKAEADARFQRLAENVPDIIYRWRIAPSPGLEYVSPAVLRLTGYTPEEFHARPELLIEIAFPDDRPLVMDVMAGKKPFEAVAFRIVRKDGSIAWMERRSAPVYDVNGQLIATDGVITDVTARMEGEQALARERNLMKALMDSLPDAIYFKDAQGRFIRVNQATVLKHGLEDPGQILGKTDADLLDRESAQAYLDSEQAIMRTGQPYVNLEWEEKWPNRPSTWVSSTKMPLRSEAGDIIGVFGISRDITERKRAEEALRESEKKYHDLVETSHDLIWMVDAQGTITFLNQASRKIYGYAPEELVGSSFLDLLTPEERLRQSELFSKLLAGGEQSVLGVETEALDRDGNRHTLVANVVIMRDEQGNAIGTMGTSTDATERKRAEKVIRESEERYRDLVENSHDLICTHDLEGKLLSVNEAAVRLTGYPRETLLQMNMADLLTPETRRIFSAYLKKIRAIGHARGLMLIQTASGETRAWEYNNTLRTEGVAVPMVRGMAHDITERRQAEQALRESEDRYRSLVETSPDAIVLFDLEGAIRFCNQRAAIMTGYATAQELIGKSAFGLAPPEQQSLIMSSIAEGLRGENRPTEFLLLRQDGGLTPAELRSTTIKDASGEPSGFLVIARDITERKQAEDALKESHARLSAFARAMPDLAFILDGDGTYIDVLGGPSELLADRIGRIKGHTMSDVLPKEQADLILKALRETIRTNSAQIVEYALDVTAGHRWFEGRLVPMESAPGEESKALMLARDVTDRRQAEERFSTAFNSSPEPMVITRLPEGEIVDCNGSYCELIGYPREDVVGRTTRDLRIVVDEKLRDEIIDEVQAKGAVRQVEARIRTRSGEARDILVSGSSITLDEKVCNLAVISDITDRKQAEEHVKLALSMLAQQHARLEALYQSGQLLNSTLDIEVVLNYLTQEAIRATEATHGQVLVARKELDVYERRSLIGFSKAQARRAASEPLPLNQGVNGRAYVTQQIVHIDDVQTEPDYFPFIPTTRSELVIPIIHDGEALGNLDLQSPKVGAFREADIAHLKALADSAAIAIQNARLYENLEAYNSILEQAVKDRTVELEGIQDRLQSILDNSPDPILLVGRRGSIETGNPALYRMFQADADTLRHKPLSELVMAEHVEDLQTAFHDVMVRRNTQRLEMTARRTDGSQFSVDMALAPVDDKSGSIGAVCNLRDISAFKEVERMKDAFVSNVSHELRTPITGIKLNLDLLKRDPQGQERYLARLVREAARLNNLIEDLLRLSRLDQGRVDLQLAPTDLGTLASQYVADRQLIAESRGISLVSGRQKQMPLVAADEGLLGQALSVLITNAINYTPAGGTVTVGAHRNKVGQKYWVGISVSDTGPGIAAEERQNLFERFFRGKAGRASSAPGTGLGLAIAKEIVDRHHGRIEVKSEGVAGKGATFTIWLRAE